MADEPSKDAEVKKEAPESPDKADDAAKNTKASDEQESKDVVTRDEYEKVLNDLKSTKGRLKKLSTLEKLAEALEVEQEEEESDWGKAAYEEVQKLKEANKQKDYEIQKRDFLKGLDVPDSIKDTIADLVPAGEEFTDKAQKAAERLLDLQPVDKPVRKPAPFRAPKSDRPVQPKDANEILEWKAKHRN